MRKKARWMLWGLVLLLAVLTAAAWREIKRENCRTYTETERRIANPDRGFYIQVSSERPERIEEVSEEVRVILLAFDLEAYGKGDLPEEKLEELRVALEAAERQHTAVVFRAAYGFRSDVAEPEQIEQMGRHIRQMAELLNVYSERILVVQAGMLGAYGEWHSGRYLEGTEEERRESRLYLLRQWEEYLNPDIKVAVRRQRFVREAEEAGILAGRLGIHNDALLSTHSDMGTYDDPELGREEELDWSNNRLSGQINGGEMPEPGERNAPENADREFGRLHLSYLNLKYNEEIISMWSRQVMDGMDAKTCLENHLGYRLFLSEIAVRQAYFPWEISGEGTCGGGMKVSITLCNAGYAPILEKYHVYVVAEAGEDTVCQEIEIPELYRISNGQSVTKELSLSVPEEFWDRGSVRNGEETVTFGLKIAPEGEASDGRDCVELANDAFPYGDGVNRIVCLEKGKQIGFLRYLRVLARN